VVKAALLGKIKDTACIDIGEQLFQRSTAKIFTAYDCSTWKSCESWQAICFRCGVRQRKSHARQTWYSCEI